MLRAVQLNLTVRSNMKNNKKNRVGSEAQYGPRPVGEILHDYLEKSNEPLARAYRARQFFPNTELCIDLKTILHSDRRARMRKDYPGVLTRDGREHYTFIETLPEQAARRNPHVFCGEFITVTRWADGTLHPNFKPTKIGGRGFTPESYA